MKTVDNSEGCSTRSLSISNFRAPECDSSSLKNYTVENRVDDKCWFFTDPVLIYNNNNKEKFVVLPYVYIQYGPLRVKCVFTS